MIDQRTAPYAALVLRVALASLFFAHLYRKYGVTGYDNWFNGWIKAGYPAWTLYYTLVVEFAGAVLLMLGVYSRYVALFALPALIAVSRRVTRIWGGSVKPGQSSSDCGRLLRT